MFGIFASLSIYFWLSLIKRRKPYIYPLPTAFFPSQHLQKLLSLTNAFLIMASYDESSKAPVSYQFTKAERSRWPGLFFYQVVEAERSRRLCICYQLREAEGSSFCWKVIEAEGSRWPGFCCQLNEAEGSTWPHFCYEFLEDGGWQ